MELRKQVTMPEKMLICTLFLTAFSTHRKRVGQSICVVLLHVRSLRRRTPRVRILPLGVTESPEYALPTAPPPTAAGLMCFM
jgi:hypothetical protein